ncbi:MAG: substrate-binding domain-containing protein [Candidatus Dormibacteria bacterium]
MARADFGLGRRLRLARLAKGMSQGELAAACGISRQAVAGMEAGSWSPSLSVALRLAVALQRSAEQLFSERESVQRVPVEQLADPAMRSGRALLVEVFGQMVAVAQQGPLAAVAGFGPASCRLEGAGQALGGSTQERRLLVAGCDPAIPLLADGLRASGSELQLIWWPCGSSRAEALLRAGLVHAAAVHRASGHAADHPGLTAIGFARWREGIVSRPDQAVTGLGDAVARGLRLANREPGSEARQLLDRELQLIAGETIPGYESHYRGHLPVAAAVADAGADYGVATEAAALAMGLDFAPLSEEDSVILLAPERIGTREATALLTALAHPTLDDQVSSIPGYDTAILAAEL